MLIVILGGGIDLKGNLPNHVYQRLDKAVEIYNKNCDQQIVLSGKYSFLYDQLKKHPPTTEAEKMAQYLLTKGIPKDKLLLEKKSQDTISNAYYLKKDFFIPQNEKSAIVVTNRFHLPRVEYIFNKIFGPDYSLKYVGVEQKLSPTEEKRLVEHQNDLLEKIKQILTPMRDGDHHFLDGKFYTIDYYRQKRPDWVIKFVAEGR